jgi:hypothetical protein
MRVVETWAGRFPCSVVTEASECLQSQVEVRLCNAILSGNECKRTTTCMHSRLLIKASVIFSPFWAQPISLTAIATPFLGSHPLLSSSAMFHISPNTMGESFAPPKTLSAASPVRMPIFWGSALAKIWVTNASSAGEGVKDICRVWDWAKGMYKCCEWLVLAK